MASIAPFSALNLYQPQPVGNVVRKPTAATAYTSPTLDQLQSLSGQNEFSAEQAVQRKISDNLVMARANAKSAQLGLFSAAQNPGAAMQNVLQAQLLPAEASANMASFASPTAQQKLNLYRNFSTTPQPTSGGVYDLLRA